MNKNRNIFDKALTAIAPRYALKRTIARKSMDIINSGYGNYGANTTKKSLRGWRYYGGSSKEDIEDNISVLRQRSRDAYMGVPTAAAALKTLRTNVIAGGLLPAPQIDSELLKLSAEETEKLQADILREFYLWADKETCDSDGIDNFYRLQKLAYLSYLMNGDVLILLQTKEHINQPYRLSIRIVEADRVCSPNGIDVLMPSTIGKYKVHRIVQGIETDEGGAVVAYWVCNQHPLSDNILATTPKWERIEAVGKKTGRRNALLYMERERAGQLRGVPILSPVIEAIKQLGRYTDAEITAAVLSSMFTVFVKSGSPTDIAPFGEMLPPEEQVDPLDQSSIELAPGAILSLNPGEEVQFADPKHPNAGYDVFTNAMIKQIGAALEIPPEVMFKQFTTSFSAARGALNEFWRTCTMHRDSFVDMFCQPIYEEWFTEAVAKGRIKAPGYFSEPVVKKAYLGCMWNGPARTNLNPVQEVNAAIQRVNAGFSTAQDETAQMTGGDYNRNIKLRIMEAAKKRVVDEIISNEFVGGE